MTGCLLKRHGLVQPWIFGLDGGITEENLLSSYAGIKQGDRNES